MIMRRTFLPALLTFCLVSSISCAQIICPNIEDAQTGSMLDAYYLGKAHDHGHCGIPQDKIDAEEWYRTAANKGHMLAAYELGETYFVGDGIDIDYPEAKKWYLIAAEKGHGSSALRLGFLYAESHFDGLKPDYEAAEKWFQFAAEKNAGDARFRLGNFYAHYKKPPDYALAVKWLTRAAKGGHRIAMFDLGRLYKNGLGVNKNTEAGIMWLTKAAENDVLQAQMALADYYTETKNPAKALKWILTIARKPTASPFWLNKAGDIFFEGWETVPTNYPAARGFYERAAKKNDPHALKRLVLIYAEGLGIAKNADKAEEYMKKIDSMNLDSSE